ncbi:hypothetical protein [Bacillus ndiopicus]|uniref:hypothetical protein n=1 Tax=Bacillus ndiopicus TaxID=1347368 RepID=UPI0005A677A5
MKKTLTAVFATFLLAAPIQIGSASANGFEGQQGQVKQATDCKVIYKWPTNHKWQIFMPSMDKQIEFKFPNFVPAPPAKEKPKGSSTTG